MDDGFRGLKLYNTLTRGKEELRPLDWRDASIPESEKRVRMYVCGPTVYDFAHIGNARPVIVFDVLFRLLRHLYGPEHVIYARNITDVDDKINARAQAEGVSIRELTERTARQFHEDVAALGCLPPTVEPRATEHIDEMKAMIARLVETGHAYVAQDHVLFHVPSMPDYGRLSGRSLDEMQAGARVDVAPYKRDPMDFVLWKPSKAGEPAWPSPCGIEVPGRPGWHIECSAMAERHLGDVFDIHGGGIDLVFPHHENEIAQSRCAHGTPAMAQIWMHNGFLQVEGAKMSKSLGNFVTIRDLLKGWPGEVIRLAMLMTHYRQPLDFTEDRLREAKRKLHKWYQIIDNLNPQKEREPDDRIFVALKNDLDTWSAIGVLDALANEISVTGGPISLEKKYVMRSSARLFGLLLKDDLGAWIASDPKSRLFVEDEIQGHIAARTEARKRRDWAEADRIRDELAAMGIALKDGPDGTTWEVLR